MGKKATVLVDLLRTMRTERASYVRLPDGTEVQLHDSAFSLPRRSLPQSPMDTQDADTCVCGHSIDVQHGPAGCLMGCPTATCAKTEAQA